MLNKLIEWSLRNQLLVTVGLVIGTPVHADKAGAFLGGLVTAKVLNNMSRRTQAEEYQAYSAPRAQPVQQAAPASSGSTPGRTPRRSSRSARTTFRSGSAATPWEWDT